MKCLQGNNTYFSTILSNTHFNMKDANKQISKTTYDWCRIQYTMATYSIGYWII